MITVLRSHLLETNNIRYINKATLIHLHLSDLNQSSCGRDGAYSTKYLKFKGIKLLTLLLLSVPGNQLFSSRVHGSF